MRTFLRRLAIVMVLLFPLAATAQEASLDQVAKAMGAAAVKSIQYTGSGLNFQVGQNYSPDLPWPRFIVKSYTRAVNYETATLRDELVRLQGEDPPRGGGGQPVRGEQRQTFVLNGDFAWTVTGEVVNPTPVALIDRQLQLWTTPHGVVKAAMVNKATVQGRAISFAVPGKYKVKATVDAQSMIERIDAVAPHAVLGDIPVEIRYSDYKDFGGVKVPTKIKQTIGAHPALELTVRDVQPNIAVDLAVHDPIRQTPAPYARVTSQMVAEGRLVPQRRPPQQRAHRDEGSPDARREPAQRGACRRRARGGQESRLEQADQVRRRDSSSLRSHRWAPSGRGRGRDRHRPRREQGLPRQGAGRAGDRQPRSAHEIRQEGHGRGHA